MTQYVDLFVAGTLLLVLSSVFLIGLWFLGNELLKWAIEIQNLWRIRNWKRRAEMIFSAWFFFCLAWVFFAAFR